MVLVNGRKVGNAMPEVTICFSVCVSRAGAFPGGDPLAPLMGAVSGPSVPLSSTEMPQQLSAIPSLPSTPLLPPLPHSMPAGPLSSTACTYVSSSLCSETHALL